MMVDDENTIVESEGVSSLSCVNADVLVSTTNSAAAKKRQTGSTGYAGLLYQAHVMIIFLLHGVLKRLQFKLYTELNEAKKFDDLVFEIINNNSSTFRCFQMKNKFGSTKVISFREVLTENSSDYSLVKYFFSFTDMKKEEMFKNGRIRNIAVFTNINFEMDDKKLQTWIENLRKSYLISVSSVEAIRARDMVRQVAELDDVDLLNVNYFSKSAVCYKFTEHIVKFLKPLLHSYNLVRLARQVAQYLLSEEDHEDFDLFRFYSCALAGKVFDAQSGTFLNNFITGKDLDINTNKFRSAVMKELNTKSKGKIGLKKINMESKYIKKIKLMILQKRNNINSNGDWPDNVITNEEIQDFLNHLIFAVDQPENHELENVIQSYYYEKYKDWDKAENLYNKLCMKIMRWMNREEEDYFISDETAKFWIEPVLQTAPLLSRKVHLHQMIRQSLLVHPDFVFDEPNMWIEESKPTKQPIQMKRQSLRVHPDFDFTETHEPNGLLVIEEGEPAKQPDRRQGLHGDIYQIKLLMLNLLIGLENKYNFKMAANMKEASAFDDVVLQISNGSNTTIQFMQAKHKDNERKQIKLSNLLDGSGDFSLLKYFKSYQSIKKQEIFKSCNIQDVTVFTNIGFDLNDEYALNDSYDRVKMSDIIQENNISCHGDHYQFTKRFAPILKTFLQNNIIRKLANRFAKSLLTSTAMRHHDENFKYYHVVLARKVIDVKRGKLQEDFVHGCNLDNNTRYFRELLENEIKVISQDTVNLATINQEICNKENRNINLILSKRFGEGNGDTWEDISDEDITEFLNHFVLAVNQPNQNELEYIIKNKIQDLYNHSDVHALYDKFFMKSVNWFNGVDGRFMTEESARMMMEDIAAPIEFAIEAPVDYFTGRDNELRELDGLVQNMRDPGNTSKLIWISGSCGIGKTELIRKYAHEYWLKFKKNVIWIDATNYSTLVDSFNQLNKKLLNINKGRTHFQPKTHDSVFEQVYLFLANSESLFIFDNASKYTSQEDGDGGINKFLKTTSNSHFFIATSRRNDCQANISTFLLKPISKDETEIFIRKFLGSENGNIGKLAEMLQRFSTFVDTTD